MIAHRRPYPIKVLGKDLETILEALSHYEVRNGISTAAVRQKLTEQVVQFNALQFQKAQFHKSQNKSCSEVDEHETHLGAS